MLTNYLCHLLHLTQVALLEPSTMMMSGNKGMKYFFQNVNIFIFLKPDLYLRVDKFLFDVKAKIREKVNTIIYATYEIMPSRKSKCLVLTESFKKL